MFQITDTLLMARPSNFRMNEQTAVNNFFQTMLSDSSQQVNVPAQLGLDNFVKKSHSIDMQVVVTEDTAPIRIRPMLCFRTMGFRFIPMPILSRSSIETPSLLKKQRKAGRELDRLGFTHITF